MKFSAPQTANSLDDQDQDQVQQDHVNQNMSALTTLTEEQKKMKRILANRNSARTSYIRRLKMIDDLHCNADSLKKENMDLVQESKTLRDEVRELKQQVLLLTMLQSRPASESKAQHHSWSGASTVHHRHDSTSAPFPSSSQPLVQPTLLDSIKLRLLQRQRRRQLVPSAGDDGARVNPYLATAHDLFLANYQISK
jgi:hypothetical protein